MEIGCAERGCVIEATVPVAVCGSSDCCCSHLPDDPRHARRSFSRAPTQLGIPRGWISRPATGVAPNPRTDPANDGLTSRVMVRTGQQVITCQSGLRRDACGRDSVRGAHGFQDDAADEGTAGGAAVPPS